MKNKIPKNITAVVLGSGIVNATGMIRSLGLQGHRVMQISPGRKICSRFLNSFAALPEQDHQKLHLLKELLSKQESPPGIFPADDESASFLDTYYPELESLAILPHANGSLTDLMKKAEMNRLAEACGLNPPGFVVWDPSESIPELKLPVIVKPGSGLTGEKGDIRICRTPVDLNRTVQEIHTKHISSPFLIQCFLESSDQFEIGIPGFSLPDGTVEIPGIIRKIRSMPDFCGSTSFAEFLQIPDGLDINKLKEFIRKTNYSGLFDIEMIFADGIFYFIEINFRNGQYGFLPTAAGFNLPCRWLSGMKKESCPPVNMKYHVCYMNEREDFKHVKEKKISLRKWVSDFQKAEVHGLYFPGDQNPFLRQFLKIPDRIVLRLRSGIKTAEEILFPEEWNIALREQTGPPLFEENGTEKPFRIIRNTFRYWFADPFLCSNNGHTYLFCEMYDRFLGKGSIGCTKIVNGKPQRIKQIFFIRTHLSFPCVFQQKNEWFLMPESSCNHDLFLAKSDEFPWKWHVSKKIFKDLDLADPVFYSDGKDQWIFTQKENDTKTGAPELLLFYSDQESWNTHPGNPIVTGKCSSRMAGKIIPFKDSLIRTAQNCSSEYGRSLRFFKIINLSRTEYQEIFLKEILAEQIHLNCRDDFRGIHTYQRDCGIEAIDLKRKKQFHPANLLHLFYRLLKYLFSAGIGQIIYLRKRT